MGKIIFEVQWRESHQDKWEVQEDFPTNRQANDWIAEQNDGGFYRIVQQPSEETPCQESN